MSLKFEISLNNEEKAEDNRWATTTVDEYRDLLNKHNFFYKDNFIYIFQKTRDGKQEILARRNCEDVKINITESQFKELQKKWREEALNRNEED